MANSNVETKTVTPVQPTPTSTLTEVKVTVEEGKETAQILYINTDKILALAFSLQEAYENESQFKRDALHDASIMFLKAQCQRAIGQWDNFVSKMTKVQKYSSMTRIQVESALKIHPKYKSMFDLAVKAAQIKNGLK